MLLTDAFRLGAAAVFTTSHIEAWAVILGVLIAATGVIAAAFRSQSSAQALANYKNLAESYKETVDQQKDHIERQDAQIHQLQAAMADKDKEMAVLGQKIQTLQEVITGRAALEQLNQSVTALRLQVAEELAFSGEARKIQRDILGHIAAIAGQMEGPVQ